MKQQIIDSVLRAFDAADDLVKDLTITKEVGVYDSTRSENVLTKTNLTVRALNDSVNKSTVPTELIRKDLKQYLVISDEEILPNDKVIDNLVEYNIWNLDIVEQNNTVFIYTLGIEK